MDYLWDFGRTPPPGSGTVSNCTTARIRISVESAVLSGEENAFAFCAGGQRTLQPERFNLSEDRFTDELASALAAARGVEFCQEPGVDGEANQFLTFCADVWHGFGI